MSENDYHLVFSDPFPLEKMPKYPSYELKVGKEGDTTYEIQETAGQPLLTIERKAKIGEILRDSDLKFIPDVTENLKFRGLTLRNCMNNPQAQQLQKHLCKSNILYFINTFLWTYDPRLSNPHIPFVTYPFQDDLITWCIWLINHKESGLIEKSRDMGATWCMEAVSLYMTLFFPGKVDYQLSLREDDVDSRSEDSLMGKYRYMLRQLPVWMQGSWKEKENGVDNKMYISIPENKSYVRGQLTGGTSGRSGRASRAFYDEFAFVEDSDKVLKAASSLSPSCLFLSTPNGMGNSFYQMASSPFVRKKSLHWTEHALKNDMWAKKERAKVQYTEETWAQEHDINYAMSTAERVYQQFTSFSASEYDWQHPQNGSYYEFDPNYDVYAGIDFGMNDPTSVVFAQVKPAPLHFNTFTKDILVIFDAYETNSKTVDKWAEYLKSQPFIYRHIVGDFRSGNQRDATGMTWIKYLGRHGIHVVGKYNTEQAPIIEVKKLLEKPGAFAINEQRCPHLVKAFQNWAYPIDKKSGQVPHGAKPKHDQWSHSMKAVCYLVDYLSSENIKKEDPVTDWDFRLFNDGKYI